MIEKLMAMKIAAELTHSVCGTFPTPGVNPSAPAMVSDIIKSENLLEWEVFRIFYSAVTQAASDDVNWPAPVALSGSATAVQAGTAVGTALAPLLSATGPLGSIIGQLSGALAPALSQLVVGKIQQATPATPTAPPPPLTAAPPTSGVVR